MATATNNQQTPGNPVTGSMLDYILQAAQNPGQQQSQALQTIMQVPELADAYNKRNAYINGVQADMAKGIVNGPSNPINGDAVNPSDPASRFASLVPQTQAMTNNFLAGLLQQATSGTNNTQNNATSLINNQQDNATTQRGQNFQYTGLPTNPMPGTGNPRIDNYVSSVMNGYIQLSQVPSDIQPLVAKALQSHGYDQGKAVFGDVAQLQSLWGNGVSESNPLAKGGGFLADLLDKIGAKTPGENAKQQYIAKANEFASKYGNVLGNKVALPEIGDTDQDALKKFDNIVRTLRNTYYQGNAGPTTK